MNVNATTAPSELVDQARALDHPQQIQGVEDGWSIALGGRTQQVTAAHLDELRAGFAAELRAGLDRARVDIAVAGGELLDPLVPSLRRAESELASGELTQAASSVVGSETSAQRALTELVAHREAIGADTTGAEPVVDWTGQSAPITAGPQLSIAAAATTDRPLAATASNDPTAAAGPKTPADPDAEVLRQLMKDPAVATRVTDPKNRASIEGALHEELVNKEMAEAIRSGRIVDLVPGRDPSKLGYVPGHMIKDTSGSGFSDGIVPEQAELVRALKAALDAKQKLKPGEKQTQPAATIELPAFVEAKAGGAGAKDLTKTPYDPQRDVDSDAARKAEQKHFEQVRREEKLEQAEAKAAKQDREPAKVYKTGLGGQIQKTYERALIDGRYVDVLINGQVAGLGDQWLLVRLKVTRNTTTAIIATPSELSTRGKVKGVQSDIPLQVKDLIGDLRDYHLNNVTAFETGTSQKAVREVANEIRGANPPPANAPPQPKAAPKAKAAPQAKAAPVPKAKNAPVKAPPPQVPAQQIELLPSEVFLPVVQPKAKGKAKAAKPPVAKEAPPVAKASPPPMPAAPASPATAEPPVAKQAPQTGRPTNAEIETELRRGRERPWERPSSGPIQHVPSPTSRFRSGAAEAIAYTLGEALNTLNEWGMERTITEQVENKQAEIEKYRREHPYDGVMVIVTIERWDPKWRPQEAHATRDLLGVSLWKGGRTREEAMAERDRGPSLRLGPDATHRIDEERRIWIKPLKGVKPHDWIGGVYTSVDDANRAIDLSFTGEGAPRIDAWRVDRPPLAFKVDDTTLDVRLPPTPGGPLNVHIRSTFADPLTKERWTSLFTLRPDGSLIEEATNPDGQRRVHLWTRTAQ